MIHAWMKVGSGIAEKITKSAFGYVNFWALSLYHA